jgi:hypothetical protein
MSLPHVKAFAAVPTGILGRFVSLICGSCKAPSTSKLRDCVSASDHQSRIVAFCPHCRTWNLTDLVMTDA